jgi:hypothetical protein
MLAHNQRSMFNSIRGRLLKIATVGVILATPAAIFGSPVAAGSVQWNIVNSQNTSAGQGNVLNSVTCVSATDCWAVGSYSIGAGDGTLIEHYDGASWSIVSSPNTSATENNGLSSVTCVSTSDCWAVGYGDNSGGVKQTLIEQWDGTSWGIVVSPNTSVTEANQLSGVTCVSGADCWAVGNYTNSGSNPQTLAENYNGTIWSIVPSPNPTGTWTGSEWYANVSTTGNGYGYLVSVTCLSATDCWAAGDNGAAMFALSWNGTSWSYSAAVPGGPTAFSYPSAITCVSPSDCYLLGINGWLWGTQYQAVVDQWNGVAWTQVIARLNVDGSNVANELAGITCLSAVDCRTVGNYYENSGTHYQTLSGQWNGTTWTQVSSPNTSTAENNFLNGVTCVFSSDCWAVGNYTNSGGYNQTLIEQYGSTPSTLALTSSASSIPVGQAVTYTASVSPSGGGGTVAFDDSGTAIAGCSAVAVVSGVASCTTTYSAVGTYGVSAAYSGGGTDAPSASNVLSEVVVVDATTTTLALPSAAGVVVGQSVTLNATVSPASATGSVAFMNGATSIAGCAAVAVTAGAASCTTTFATVGTYAFSSNYGGDATHAASSSNVVTLGIAPTTTATSLALSPSATIVVGQLVTLTANVSPANATGTVAFENNAVGITGCQSMSVTSGTAHCTTSFPTVGTYSLSAAYGGDAQHSPSSSAAVHENVVAATTGIQMTASPPTVIMGQKMGLTATVMVEAPGRGVPAGSVTFEAGGMPISGCSSVPLDGTGVARCVAVFVRPGSYRLSATYNGATSYTGAVLGIAVVVAVQSPIPTPSTGIGGSGWSEQEGLGVGALLAGMTLMTYAARRRRGVESRPALDTGGSNRAIASIAAPAMTEPPWSRMLELVRAIQAEGYAVESVSRAVLGAANADISSRLQQVRLANDLSLSDQVRTLRQELDILIHARPAWGCR